MSSESKDSTTGSQPTDRISADVESIGVVPVDEKHVDFPNLQCGSAQPASIVHESDLSSQITDHNVEQCDTSDPSIKSHLGDTEEDSAINQKQFSVSRDNTAYSRKRLNSQNLQQPYHPENTVSYQDSYYQDDNAYDDDDDLNDPDGAESYLLDSQQEYFRDPMVDYYDTQLYKEDVRSGYFSKSQSLEENYYNEFHRRHPLNFDKDNDDYKAEKGNDSTDDEEPPKDFENKELVDPGPFLYNRKVCIAAVPCAAVVLYLVGEWLTGILVMGYLLVTLLRVMGEDRRCIIVILMIFFPTQIFITYSVFPLIWVSFTNLVFVGVINIYAMLTAGWIVVQFSSFRKEELFLCRLIEKFLFGVYPTACAWILTWTISQFVSPIHFPYILLFTWFLFLQMFLVPVPTSFVLNPAETDSINVIEPVESGAIAIMFLIIPIFVQLYQGLLTSIFSGILTSVFLVQLLFITALSIFLTTLLGIRQFVESTGWSQTMVRKVRWISGLTATFLLYFVFNNIGLSSHYLPWLPVAIVSYSGYGVLIGTKKYRNFALTGGLCLILLYTFWVYKLPWQINNNVMYFIPVLLFNAFLCVSLIYLSSYGSMELLGALLFPHSIVFVLSEIYLLVSELYSLPAVMFTGAAVSYLIYRLHMSQKITDRTANLSLSVYLTVIAMTTLMYLQKTEVSVSFYHYLTMYLMVFCLLKIFLFDNPEDLTLKQSLVNCLAMAVSVGLNASLLLSTLSRYLLEEQPSTSDCIGMYFLIIGLLVILESFLLGETDSEDQLLGAGVISFIAGVAVVIQQPDLTVSSSSLLQWSVVFSLTSFTGFLLSPRVNHFAYLCIISVVISACPSIQITEKLMTPHWNKLVELVPVRGHQLWFERKLYEEPSTFHYLLIYLLSMCCCLFIILTTKVKTKVEEVYSIIMSLLTTISSVVLITLELVNPVGSSLSSTWKLLCISYLIIAASFKIQSLSKEGEIIPLVDNKDKKVTPIVPTVGNITTVVAYMFLCSVGPSSGFLADIWCCGSSVILLCLQNDKRLFFTLKPGNLIAPVVMLSIANLTLMSFVRSNLWNGGGWMFFMGFWELILVILTLPMYYTLWGFLWDDNLITLEQVVVFLMPINAVLLLIASSHTCMTFAAIGLFSGIWMMIYKLPLIPYSVKSEVAYS